jgi:hypothetical protein
VESFCTSATPPEGRGTVRAYGLWTFGACSQNVVVIYTENVNETDLCTLACGPSMDYPCASSDDLC